MTLNIEEYYKKPRARAQPGSMGAVFEELASGRKGQPRNGVFYLINDFGYDLYTCRFFSSFVSNMSPFTRHIAASIPLNIENDCRLGVATCLYGNALGRKITYHSLASADGCMARTISEFSHAHVMTLTNSPTATIAILNRYREQQKDNCFKAKHFTPEQIQEKKQTILVGEKSSSMQANQVSMEDLIHVISLHFEHAALIENSGNFYRIVASDNADALKVFVGSILKMPKTQYCYENLPRPLLGLVGSKLCFRDPDNAWFYRQVTHSV